MGYSSVEIIERDGQFVVVITEDGDVTENSFSIRENAEAWASGQKVRLGLLIDDTD